MKVLVIVGSARPNSTANKLTSSVAKAFTNSEVTFYKPVNLPFFNEDIPPAMLGERMAYPDEEVQRFTKAVIEADLVVLLSPEYNHGLPAVLKNALDWVYREWEKKPVYVITYGVIGGPYSTQHLSDILAHLKVEVKGNMKITLDEVNKELAQVESALREAFLSIT